MPGPQIILFPISLGCLSSPNVVGFCQTSSNTKMKDDLEWAKMTKEWCKEQLIRARLCLQYWSIFHQLRTLPRFAAPLTPPPTTTTVMEKDDSTSFCQAM